ncbi:F-type H+-transporting ATPase subunit epsilon [Poseidonocella pacifica]|uniref:ATP synthase epsilon chain n=1 Tax=Poseidonocella pacifica TaxID=871651 RepID=A0A1I0UY64_9RHOB|nr:ATPase [Poseidonocella pacifica]SFA69049.1 F-type H+-transporting ATPase subunit epsilon [Poseidonocella pacifica]
MSMARSMSVCLRLPTSTLFEGQAERLTAVAPTGAFGLLPNHIDFVSALVPSVMTLRLVDGSEAIFGIDEGLLVKKGHSVDVAVLRGVLGDDLSSLKHTVESRFVQVDEEERQARSALSRLEADMVRRFAELKTPAP